MGKQIGYLRVGCFEAMVLRKALRILLGLPVEELWDRDDTNHAIILQGRIGDMIEKKDC